MQRWTPPIALAIIAALVICGFRFPTPVRAATLPAGWNLVAGADGATLSGATGQIYSLQPGDADYEVFAADRPLKAGWGYWAFFPNGGSVNSPGSRNGYSVALTAGAWAMIGNPTSDCSVTVSGADTVLTYTPSAGYQQTPTLGVGQGAWVSGSGTVTLTPGACTAQPSAPSPTATPPPSASSAPAATPPGHDLTTIAGLQNVALQQSDLPGYSKSDREPDLLASLGGGSVGYRAVWLDQDTHSPRIAVENILQTYPTPALAHSGFMRYVADSLNPDLGDPSLKIGNIAPQGSKGLGDEDTGAYFQVTNGYGVQFDHCVETFDAASRWSS